MKKFNLLLISALLLPAVAWAQVPLTGEGTAESPYLVCDTADWNALADYVTANDGTAVAQFSEQYIRLENDLDFTGGTFKPLIWNSLHTFAGTFLGNNKTISGINYTTTGTYEAVFNRVEGGVVRDLTVEGVIYSSKFGTAGLVAVLSRQVNGTEIKQGQIINCVSKVNVISSSSRTAGIVNSASVGTCIINCKNYGNITNTETYTVNAFGTVLNYSGGIVGTAENNVVIEGCHNVGTVTGGSIAVGGIVGYCYSGPDVISHCVNEGNVTAGMYGAGGILGFSTNGLVNYPITIQDCLNRGSVTTASEDAANGYGIGGIFGSGTMVTATNCVNTGTVTGVAKVGGIIGDPAQNCAATDCYNAGVIDAPEGEGYNVLGVQYNIATGCYYVSDLTDAEDFTADPLTLAELCTRDMGADWTGYDTWSMPMPTSIAAVAAAKVSAAEVIVAEGDTRAHVTADFKVGTPDGVTWTADRPEVAFDGNTGKLVSAYTGMVNITATCGTSAKTIALNVDYAGGASVIGDVNGDGLVNVMDVTAVINHILGNTPAGFNQEAADLNGDSQINVMDITALINIILGNSGE